MIRVEMPKDITTVESKIGGYVTPRQLVCLVIALILTYFLRSLLPGDKLKDVRDFLSVVVITLPMTFAVFKPYGMPLEKFLLDAFRDNVLAPKRRTYQSENNYEQEYLDMLKEEKKLCETYDRIHGVKKSKKVRNDPNDRPAIKKNKANPELTGYI